MKTKEQDVEVYESFDVYNIAYNMRDKIDEGWLVYTCLNVGNKFIVIYERELETYN